MRRLPAGRRLDPGGGARQDAGTRSCATSASTSPYTRQELFWIVKLGRIESFDALLDGHGRGDGCEVCRPAVASILAATWNDLDLRARDDPGHQRPLPREHPARRHVLGDPADSGRRDHAREADRARRGREEVRPLLQDHRRPAHRPARRARRSAPADLGGPGRRGLRERPRLRQGDAHGEELHRVDLVPLRRAGLDRARDPDRGALPRPPRAAQAQVGRLGLHPRVRRGAEQGLRRHRDREGLERLPVRQRRKPSAPRRPVRDRPRRRRRDPRSRSLPDVLHPDRQAARSARRAGSRSSRAGSPGSSEIVLDDALGICDQLEADMQQLVDTYRCEWRAVVESPELRARFRHFADTTDADDAIAFVRERDQKRPADWAAPDPPALRGDVPPKHTWTWQKLARAEQFPANGGAAIRYGAVQIAIYNFARRGEWFATQAMCPAPQGQRARARAARRPGRRAEGRVPAAQEDLLAADGQGPVRPQLPGARVPGRATRRRDLGEAAARRVARARDRVREGAHERRRRSSRRTASRACSTSCSRSSSSSPAVDVFAQRHDDGELPTPRASTKSGSRSAGRRARASSSRFASTSTRARAARRASPRATA